MARILVVEDDESIREIIREALEFVGHEVEEAPGGVEGSRLFREDPADLVIADLVMPGKQKQGLELIQELKRDYPEVRIIAISEVLDRAVLDRAKELGAQYALKKPFELTVMLEGRSDPPGWPVKLSADRDVFGGDGVGAQSPHKQRCMS